MVIRDGKSLIAKLDSMFDQILGVGCPVEEGKIGVAMKFGISRHRVHYIEHMFDPYQMKPLSLLEGRNQQ